MISFGKEVVLIGVDDKIASWISKEVREEHRKAVELYIDAGDKLKNKNLFDDLYESRQDIEGDLGELSWERLENKKGCRIAVYSDITNSDEEMNNWSVGKLIEFIKVFKKFI